MVDYEKVKNFAHKVAKKERERIFDYWVGCACGMDASDLANSAYYEYYKNAYNVALAEEYKKESE